MGLGLWVCGFVGLCFVGLWVYGFMGLWVCGRLCDWLSLVVFVCVSVCPCVFCGCVFVCDCVCGECEGLFVC